MRAVFLIFLLFSFQLLAVDYDPVKYLVVPIIDGPEFNISTEDLKECQADQQNQNYEVAEADQLIEKVKRINNNGDLLQAYAECLGKNFPFDISPYKNQKNVRGFFYSAAGGVKPKAKELINALAVRSKWGATQHYFKEMQDLNAHNKQTDIAHVMTIAHRESSTGVISASKELMNSYGQGGLDNVGNHYKGLKEKYLPAGYGTSWKIAKDEHPNEGGFIGRPADIPRREMAVAYGSYLEKNFDSFREKAKKYGFTDNDIDNLTPEAKRFWSAIYFAGSGGREWNKSNPPPARFFGGITCLTLFKQKIEAGEIQSLNDLSALKDVIGYHRTQIAVATAANSTLLNDVMGFGPRSETGKKCSEEFEKLKEATE